MVLLVETATVCRLPSSRRTSHLAGQSYGRVQGHQFWSAWKPSGNRPQRRIPSACVILSDTAGKGNLFAVCVVGWRDCLNQDLRDSPGAGLVGQGFGRVVRELYECFQVYSCLCAFGEEKSGHVGSCRQKSGKVGCFKLCSVKFNGAILHRLDRFRSRFPVPAASLGPSRRQKHVDYRAFGVQYVVNWRVWSIHVGSRLQKSGHGGKCRVHVGLSQIGSCNLDIRECIWRLPPLIGGDSWTG